MDHFNTIPFLSFSFNGLNWMVIPEVTSSVSSGLLTPHCTTQPRPTPIQSRTRPSFESKCDQPQSPFPDCLSHSPTSDLGHPPPPPYTSKMAPTDMKAPQAPETIKIGTRASKLAIKQAELVAAQLRRAFPRSDVQIVPMSTGGDLNKVLPFFLTSLLPSITSSLYLSPLSTTK